MYALLHALRANDALHHSGAEFGFFLVVDRRRIEPLEGELGLAIHGGGGVLRDLAHAPLDQVERFERKGAHGATQHGFVGDDVVGAACVYLGDAQYRRIQRVAVARDDGLERLRDLDRRDDGINAEVRHPGMRTLAANHDIEAVARGHDRPGREPEGAERQAGPVMHAENGIHREE